MDYLHYHFALMLAERLLNEMGKDRAFRFVEERIDVEPSDQRDFHLAVLKAIRTLDPPS